MEDNLNGVLNTSNMVNNSMIDCGHLRIPQIEAFFAHLQEDEAQMMALFGFIENPVRPPRVPPSGNIEFGFMLYWIHHPPVELLALLAEHPVLGQFFTCFQQMAPASKITEADYHAVTEAIADGGVAWTDGTMIGTGKYEQLDPKWAIAAINYAVNLVFPSTLEHFRTGASKSLPAPVPLKSSGGNTLSLAIVGDWGAGSYSETNGEICPAIRVRDQMDNRAVTAADYFIHLGDTYYAGTGAWRAPVNEETHNLYDLWPQDWSGKSYTLNSNHEMYGAAEGYYKTALQQGGKFSAQAGLSYFALTYGEWLILGLDSAYYSDAGNATPAHPHNFYMEGAIGSPVHTAQTDWLAQFKTHTGPIMVMTHHTACDLTGAQTNLLYQQVEDALGRGPTLWYWGHLHNGIVYDQLGGSGGASPTKGRCCGHGSIPFGRAWGLEDSSGNLLPNIEYFARTPDPKAPNGNAGNAKTRMRNGYAVIDLGHDGGCTEKFYEVDTDTPVWSRRWSAGELA